MRQAHPFFLLMALAGAARGQVPADVHTVLTETVIPHGLGVNIHFTDPQPGEMERFAEGGFGLVRMDFAWGGIERVKGQYDFSAYDRLVKHLNQVGAYPYFILDYANRHYDGGVAPYTDDGRAAFARFASAAAAHYRGQPILWEIWNEPNLDGFWKPHADASAYAQLALATARAIKKTDPKAVVLAPGTSEFPWEFLETSFRAGLLEHIDAVSVHPYRGSAPETAAVEYARLRGLIARFAPEGKAMLPIVSGEWGYSTAVPNGHLMIPEAQQARYLAREYLANVAAGVNVSIFYDWKDDGPDASEKEHRFGTVRQDLTPKPSFVAARELIQALRGYTFRHRLAPRTPHDWRLLFQKGDSDALTLVEWSSDPKADEVSQTPRYRAVEPSDPQFGPLRSLASIRFTPGTRPEWRQTPASFDVSLVNPYASPSRIAIEGDGVTVSPVSLAVVGPGESLTVHVSLPIATAAGDDDRTQVPLRLTWNGEALPTIAPIEVIRVDPVRLSVVPRDSDLAVVIDNPAARPLTGTLAVGDRQVAVVNITNDVRTTIAVPRSQKTPGRLALLGPDGQAIASAELPQTAPLGAPASGFRSVLHVDNQGQAAVALKSTTTHGDDDAPAAQALAVPYTFDPGWRYLTVQPPAELKAPPDAVALSFWVRPDGTRNALRARIRDASGQVFQRDLGQLEGTTWRPARIDLTASAVAPGQSWGGAGDGVVHPPVSIEALVLIDSADQKSPRSGEVRIAAPSFVLGTGAP
jgi:hypothetical protein